MKKWWRGRRRRRIARDEGGGGGGQGAERYDTGCKEQMGVGVWGDGVRVKVWSENK